MTTIIVDKSEKSSAPHIVESLSKYFKVISANLPHRIYGNKKITAGDINIPLDDGTVLAIERKTGSDLLNSIKERHILNQVEVMHTHAKWCAVIVTGKISYSPNDMVIVDKRETEWGGASVRALLDTIQFSGCAVRFCPETEYPLMVREIYDLASKPDKHRGLVKNRIITFPPVDERVQFLAQLPGIGLETAESLLQFAGMMDKNADGDGFGTLVSALHWMSILSGVDQDSRPKNWGGKKILTTRKFFGLASDEYIAQVKELKNETVIVSGQLYGKTPF